jgi:mannosyl-oligosaccharide glucosidase
LVNSNLGYAESLKKGESYSEKDSVVNMMFYFGLEAGDLNMLNEPSASGYSGDVSFAGSVDDLGGDFEILVRDTGKRNLDSLVQKTHAELNSLDNTHVLGAKVPKGELWKIRDMVYQTIIQQAHKMHKALIPTPSVAHILSLPNQLAFNPNTFVVSKVLRSPFQVSLFAFLLDSLIFLSSLNKMERMSLAQCGMK